MTETRTEDGPAIPVGMAIGQVVGQAETVLTKLLAGVLAEAGATRETYLAMQRLLVRGDEADRDAYVRDLGDWLDLDLWSAGELADSLVAEGLFRLDDETIRLAPSRRGVARAHPPRHRGPHGAGMGAARSRRRRDHGPDAATRHHAGAGPAPGRGRSTLMATSNLPGTDAARHGTGDADLTIMLAAHAAFRRDLVRLAHSATASSARPVASCRYPSGLGNLQAPAPPAPHRGRHDHLARAPSAPGPQRPRPVRPRRHGGRTPAHRPAAGSGRRSIRRARREQPRRRDSRPHQPLTAHLTHEERDGLPLIGVALTAAEWRAAGFKIARSSGLSDAGEMFAWLADGADKDTAAGDDRHPAPTRKSAVPRNLETPLPAHPTLVSTRTVTPTRGCCTGTGMRVARRVRP